MAVYGGVTIIVAAGVVAGKKQLLMQYLVLFLVISPCSSVRDVTRSAAEPSYARC